MHVLVALVDLLEEVCDVFDMVLHLSLVEEALVHLYLDEGNLLIEENGAQDVRKAVSDLERVDGRNLVM